MRTTSVWQETKTFFPLFLDQLDRDHAESVYVIGASDGKFVVPLARQGIEVYAIERSPLALDGGPVTMPGHVQGTMHGLRRRLAAEGLEDRVEIIEADVLELSGDTLEPADAIWTSCSWHYSVNHRRSLARFIDTMKALCRAPGGLLGAEYMMPVEPRHHGIEHYLEAGEIRHYLTNWQILWETYTPPFVEAPHVEQLQEHIHRMGLVIARRPNTGGKRT